MQPASVWEKNRTCVRPDWELVVPAASKLQGLLLQLVSQPHVIYCRRWHENLTVYWTWSWRMETCPRIHLALVQACNFSSQCGQQWSQRLRDLGGNQEGFVPSNGRRGKLWCWQLFCFWFDSGEYSGVSGSALPSADIATTTNYGNYCHPSFVPENDELNGSFCSKLTRSADGKGSNDTLSKIKLAVFHVQRETRQMKNTKPRKDYCWEKDVFLDLLLNKSSLLHSDLSMLQDTRLCLQGYGRVISRLGYVVQSPILSQKHLWPGRRFTEGIGSRHRIWLR